MRIESIGLNAVLHPAPPIVVLTGVSGSGKTTIGLALAERLGWQFQEGDALHPPANCEKMANGVPLDDADRAPWLQALADWIDRQQRSGQPALLTCSALKRRYREVLRAGRANVWFVHLRVDPAVLVQRVRARPGHFMPASLLPSQLALYEPFAAGEPGLELDAEGAPAATVGAPLNLARPAIDR